MSWGSVLGPGPQPLLLQWARGAMTGRCRLLRPEGEELGRPDGATGITLGAEGKGPFSTDTAHGVCTTVVQVLRLAHV